ncbi:MAG: 4Fe-4S binding protein, partial [Acidimicrobiales bacterium]
MVRRNVAAIDAALDELHEVPVGVVGSSLRVRPAVPEGAPDFVQRVTRLMLEGRGDLLPVSAFPPDGTWPTGTSRFEKRSIAADIPIWEPDLCIQCNRCSMICPHAAIRTKAFEPAAIEGDPAGLTPIPEAHTADLAGRSFLVQVSPDDCTGCTLCVEVCPAKDRSQPKRKALNMAPVSERQDRERAKWAAFERIPDLPRQQIPLLSRTVPLLPPLFEFSGACSGCGETPYLRLLTQLFGDRLVVANATGCSSIYGGNLPTTPWTVDADGRGPAWSNSLFEDNAEFGFGMRLGIDALAARARLLLHRLADLVAPALLAELDGPAEADAA